VLLVYVTLLSFLLKSESGLNELAGFAPNLGANYIELGAYAADSPREVICYLTVRDIVRSPFPFSQSQALTA
jgi:hypothetical protein